MIASRTATTIPSQDAEQHDPGGGHQGDAERAPAHLVVAAQQRQVHQRQRRGDDHGRERRLRQVGEQRVEEEQEGRDEPGADQPGQLGLRPRLLGDGGPRAARRDGEPLEEAGRDVGGPDADHLLVGLDLFAAPGREAGRRRDRVGQRDQGDAERRERAAPGRRRRSSREARAWARPGAATRPSRPRGRRGRRRAETTVAATTADEDRRQAFGQERQHEQDARGPRARGRASRCGSGRGRRRTPSARRGTSRRRSRSRTASAAARR